MCLAMPAQVVELVADGRAKVATNGVSMEVSVALVPDARVGDWLVVHVGYALSRIDPEAAAATLAAMEGVV
ncbi:MAG: HypC/HybG/HupF family hydrogenase formation chaperone [Alphaproteobacteria bacterium]|nr:HypC/HybG/HupF family hydrogenase formation chaperone [Alphaproteobacteria bacterium]TAD89161.1 MAG: HypC/HybG/HupF family hydrogenase formation chaperone [Alphaproteobacteria bacterium]